MGGIHASVLPEEAKRHCDSVVIGSCENIWSTLLQDATLGKLQDYYYGDLLGATDIPFADFSIVRKYRYFANVIEIMRGCKYKCKFCAAVLLNKKGYRYKSIDIVLNELDLWQGKKGLFACTNLTADFEKARELFRAILPYNISWWTDATLDIVADRELLALASEAGCTYVLIGMESISPHTLKSMNKRHNILYDYKSAVRILHDYNINVAAPFIFGWDTDDKSVFKATVEFIHTCDIDLPGFSILTPFPGTAIYTQYKRENRILTEDWHKYSGMEVVYKPKLMTEEELLNGFLDAWDDTTAPKHIIRRVFARWRGLEMGLYNLMFNVYLRLKTRTLLRINTARHNNYCHHNN
jgi:radical SAM superfamily enzyme YgiQ (UPF0313 family)